MVFHVILKTLDEAKLFKNFEFINLYKKTFYSIDGSTCIQLLLVPFEPPYN